MDELELIRWLKHQPPGRSNLTRLIGDDAAILNSPQSHQLVVTTDMLMDGTHFLTSEHTPEEITHKIVHVNLSDIASMGAEPLALFASWAFPKNQQHQDSHLPFLQATLAECERVPIQLGGGDTNFWDGPLVASITALGLVPKGEAWTRSGACPGDHIVVTGDFGGSILGNHLDFSARLGLAQTLRKQIPEIRCATDVSDGLSVDLFHICEESDCAAVIDPHRIPASEQAVIQGNRTGFPPIQHALGDGEDFELILAVPDRVLDRLPESINGIALTRLGQFVEGAPQIFEQRRDRTVPMPVTGFQHRSQS